MKRSKFSDEQITFALRQHEAGKPAGEVCRQLGISEATFYKWKKKYANLGVSELRELRQLREENSCLKRPVADLTLDKQILSDIEKKALKPARRRELVGWIHDTYDTSMRRACELAQFSRAGWYRKSTARDQTPLRRRIKEIALSRPRFGYQRIHVMLRSEGWA